MDEPACRGNDNFVGSLSVFSGCYDAGRAAALSGVPKSTVYWWARQQIVVPSVSPVQEKLWSFGDLMALRLVAWLRHVKIQNDVEIVRRSPMSEVRGAIQMLNANGISLWDHELQRSPILVDARGQIFVRLGRSEIVDLRGAKALPKLETFGLTEPFSVEDANPAPDLLAPREHLRIVPGKVAGEPHVLNTRVTSLALGALARDGFAAARIADMYGLKSDVVEEAISLERQLGTLTESAA